MLQVLQRGHHGTWLQVLSRIDPGNADKINSLIEEVEQKTSSEIAVVTVGSIAPDDEKSYARALFDNWKPGKDESKLLGEFQLCRYQLLV